MDRKIDESYISYVDRASQSLADRPDWLSMWWKQFLVSFTAQNH